MFARRISIGMTALLFFLTTCAIAPGATNSSLPAPKDTAPAPSPSWQADVGRAIEGAASDDTGLTVVAGQRRVDEQQRFQVAALGSDGSRVWTETFHPMRSVNSGSWGEAVALDREGRAYAVGNVWHCRYGCESGFWFIRAYTSEGALRWTHGVRGYLDPRQWHASGIDVWRRGVVVSGYDYDDYAGPTHSWVRSYRLDGTLRWVRTVATPGGRDLRMTASDVAVSQAGTIFVAGSLEPNVGLEADHDQEPFVQRLSRRGETGWTRVFREKGDADSDRAYAIDVHGRAIVVGGVLGNGIGYAQPRPHLGWLARLAADGGLMWMRTWGATHPQDVEDVAILPSGRIVTVGGVETVDRSYALIQRTYGRGGELQATWGVNPDGPSLVGTAVTNDAAGTSIVGTSYKNRYLGDPIGGRIWRFQP